MNKRGASNVEFILAFILFVSFVVMALYFFNPVRDLKTMETSRDYVMNEIIKETRVDVDSYSVVITAPNDNKCLIIDIPEEKNVRAEDYYGRPMKVSVNKDIGKIYLTRENEEKFALLRFSEDIVASGDEGCSGGTNGGTTIASSVTDSVLSEARIRSMSQEYAADYDAFKSRMNIPSNIEFSFIFELPGEDTISAERTRPLRGQVFSETKIREVIGPDGKSQFGYLTVSVW